MVNMTWLSGDMRKGGRVVENIEVGIIFGGRNEASPSEEINVHVASVTIYQVTIYQVTTKPSEALAQTNFFLATGFIKISIIFSLLWIFYSTINLSSTISRIK